VEQESLKSVRIFAPNPNSAKHSNKINRVHRVSSFPRPRLTTAIVAYLLFKTTCLLAQAPSVIQDLAHGVVISAQGGPVGAAMVEVRDFRGIRVGRSFTDSSGKFEIPASASPGEYTVIAAKESFLEDVRVSLKQPSPYLQITLPALPEEVAPEPPRDTVSAAQLSTRGKVWKHLRAADREFKKQNFAGAEVEIGHALDADPDCAASFTMRAFLRLAEKDAARALEDARRSVSIDPRAADSWVAVAMAANKLKQFQIAEAAATHAVAIRPDSFQGRLELAKSFYGQGRLVVTLWELDQLRVDFPDVHLVRGNVLMGLEGPLEAADEFETFLREAPDDSRNARIREIIASSRQNLSSATAQQ